VAILVAVAFVALGLMQLSLEHRARRGRFARVARYASYLILIGLGITVYLFNR